MSSKKVLRALHHADELEKDVAKVSRKNRHPLIKRIELIVLTTRTQLLEEDQEAVHQEAAPEDHKITPDLLNFRKNVHS
ncbi:unnamed protein product [Caenorhabditis angaria]|uniref:Uncharacterized protein n=1 Tax=Caenorhabditis angaria TaxID=860376 RepID=A0A9P1IP84_9PELO|nr:unnamed protein product [Caenorhabditis angaria]